MCDMWDFTFPLCDRLLGTSRNAGGFEAQLTGVRKWDGQGPVFLKSRCEIIVSRARPAGRGD